MAALALLEAHHCRGQQVIEFGAAFMRRHVVGVQGIGSAHSGLCLPAARSEQHSKGESQVCLLNGTSNAGGSLDKTPSSSGPSQEKQVWRQAPLVIFDHSQFYCLFHLRFI